MKRLLLSVVASLVIASGAQAQSTQFRGYQDFSRIMGQRIIQGNLPLGLFQYAGGDSSLLQLLGAWTGFGRESVFINGNPNSVNMLVWYSVLNGVAGDISRSCRGPVGGLPLKPGFQTSLQALCAWPAGSAKSEDVMMAFWLGLMGYTAPEEEYQAWRAFFLTSSYKDRPAAEAVRAMALSILMNPYLLLQN